MTEPVSVPAPEGTIAAREIPFHILHDAEIISAKGVTKFFRDPHKFADGRPKFPAECNLGYVGNCLPQGQLFWMDRLSVHVKGVQNEKFKVRIKLCQTVAFEAEVTCGYKNAVYVRLPKIVMGQPKKELFQQPAEGETVKPQDFQLLSQEHFEVEVEPLDEKTRGKYAKVCLHGNMIQAFQA